eukprot:6205133-Pleurochrysis_carterae.AAC.1
MNTDSPSTTDVRGDGYERKQGGARGHRSRFHTRMEVAMMPTIHLIAASLTGTLKRARVRTPCPTRAGRDGR